MGSRGPLGKNGANQRVQGANLLRRIPSAPEGLEEAGRAEWKRVGSELGPRGRNVLTEAAVGLLEDLARAADDAARFRRAWQEEGLTVVGKGREFAHPMIAAEREARNTMHRLRRELGVTPASVVRVPAGPSTDEPKTDPLSEFDT